MEPQLFWDDIDVMVKDGWDPPLAWMTKLIKLIQDGKIKQNTNEKLAEFSASVETYPGASHFIDEIKDSTVVCRCENITAEEIKKSSRLTGDYDINRIKAFCRVGMGRGQGRICGVTTAEILSILH